MNLTPIAFLFSTNLDGHVSSGRIESREVAEECLRQFALGAGLDVHIHPADYTSQLSVSTAFPKGGDMFYDAVAVLRPVFEAR